MNDGVYPRVCGGTWIKPRAMRCETGLSPRMRGNRKSCRYAECRHRSIPAYAGEPVGMVACHSAQGVYPRVCGGTFVSRLLTDCGVGLSPRMRGNPAGRGEGDTREWSIPAYAGEPQYI